MDSDTKEEEVSVPSPSDDEEKESTHPTEIKWTTSGKYYHRDEFPIQSGLTESSRSYESPLSFFQLYVPDSMLDIIVEATNQYGKNKYEEK